MKLVLEVRANDPYWDDHPDLFIAEVDDAFKERVRQLAAVVADVDAYQIEEFNYVGEYYNNILNLIDVEGGKPIVQEALDKIQNTEPERTDCNTLLVTEDRFKFSAYPKNGGSNTELNTVQVPIDQLDEDIVILIETC
jgi:hypothetical protein